MSDTQDEVLDLCFIDLCQVGDGDDVFRGGALLTDNRGKPQEFWCTSAIKPNPIQKVLYGDTLWPYVHVHLVARPLFNAFKKEPDIIFVNDLRFLGLRESLDIPILIVAKQGGNLADAESDGIEQSKGESLHDPSGKFDPVIVTSHGQYAKDLSAFDLTQLFRSIDLIEPFSRVQTVLNMVHNNPPRND